MRAAKISSDLFDLFKSQLNGRRHGNSEGGGGGVGENIVPQTEPPCALKLAMKRRHLLRFN